MCGKLEQFSGVRLVISRSWVQVPAGAVGKFSSPGSTFCADSYFGIHLVTTEAHKRSQSFCQKCRWQVTAKHTQTLPMWLWMKWRCKLVHGWTVSTELAPRRQQFQLAPVTQQASTTVSTPLWWMLKICAQRGYSHSFRITCDTSAVSLFMSREQRWIKAINNNSNLRSGRDVFPLWPVQPRDHLGFGHTLRARPTRRRNQLDHHVLDAVDLAQRIVRAANARAVHGFGPQPVAEVLHLLVVIALQRDNNNNIFKAQNLVLRDYSKCIYMQRRTV